MVVGLQCVRVRGGVATWNWLHVDVSAPTCHLHLPYVLGNFELLEEREGEAAYFDPHSLERVERNGGMLHLQHGGSFYAPSTLTCLAVRLPRIVAVNALGELLHLVAAEAGAAEARAAEKGVTAADVQLSVLGKNTGGGCCVVQ